MHFLKRIVPLTIAASIAISNISYAYIIEHDYDWWKSSLTDKYGYYDYNGDLFFIHSYLLGNREYIKVDDLFKIINAENYNDVCEGDFRYNISKDIISVDIGGDSTIKLDRESTVDQKISSTVVYVKDTHKSWYTPRQKRIISDSVQVSAINKTLLTLIWDQLDDKTARKNQNSKYDKPDSFTFRDIIECVSINDEVYVNTADMALTMYTLYQECSDLKRFCANVSELATGIDFDTDFGRYINDFNRNANYHKFDW